MTFKEFEAQQHKKRVEHFIHFCESENHRRGGRMNFDSAVEDAIQIFGFSKIECEKIVADSKQTLPRR